MDNANRKMTLKNGTGWTVAIALAALLTGGIGSAAIGHSQYVKVLDRLEVLTQRMQNSEKEIVEVKVLVSQRTIRLDSSIDKLERTTEDLKKEIQTLRQIIPMGRK